MSDSILEQLRQLPSHWHFVAVGRDKKAYQKGWDKNPLDRDAAGEEIWAGRAVAVGAQAGPASGGLLFVDFDGESAAAKSAELGISADSLPETWCVTSGKRGRFQLLYLVPERYWFAMRGRRVFKTGAVGPDDKDENLDLRWQGHYSVLIGSHPETAGYYWLAGRGPGDIDIAEAPVSLIELLRKPEPRKSVPMTPAPLVSGDTVPLLDFVSRETRELIEGGGSPGSWNDDHLRMSLDLIGAERWLLSQGARPDRTARDAFASHIAVAASRESSFDERKAWRRFEGAKSKSAGPSTPSTKLEQRLAYHRRGPHAKDGKRKATTRKSATDVKTKAERVSGEAKLLPLDRISIKCLGFDGDDYFYQSKDSGQVARITRAQHVQVHLVALADLSEWESAYPRMTDEGEVVGVCWKNAVNDLFRRQHQVGVFDPDYVRGRGAWMDDGRVVFHLGDRLIVDGKRHSVLDPPPTRYFYEQSRHLDGPGDRPMDDESAMMVRLISSRFRWEVEASHHFLVGWIVLAPVCGALNWRPHIWVTGGAGTGKTTILKTFMRPLMGGVLQSATGGTTEAGLRGTLKSDAIPVVFDEFEQNEQRDKLIVQNVLALARIASSEGGKIYKGTTSGGSNSFEIRSMFCVSSINVSLIQKADVDRFCVLGLRKDHMDKNEWLDFEKNILEIATVENGRALIARTLENLPDIVHNSRVLAQALGRRFGQRFGDQHGTLLAGSWSLETGGGGRMSLEMAEDWIGQMSWDHQQSDPSESDEMKCRDVILQQIPRQGADGVDASFGEMVDCVVRQQSLGQCYWERLVPVLGRHGLKVFRKGERLPDGEEAACDYLAIANGNAQLDQVLRATPWSGGAHRASLRRLTGALVPSRPTHFAGIGTKRCVLAPLDAMEGSA